MASSAQCCPLNQKVERTIRVMLETVCFLREVIKHHDMTLAATPCQLTAGSHLRPGGASKICTRALTTPTPYIFPSSLPLFLPFFFFPHVDLTS